MAGLTTAQEIADKVLATIETWESCGGGKELRMPVLGDLEFADAVVRELIVHGFPAKAQQSQRWCDDHGVMEDALPQITVRRRKIGGDVLGRR